MLFLLNIYDRQTYKKSDPIRIPFFPIGRYEVRNPKKYKVYRLPQRSYKVENTVPCSAVAKISPSVIAFQEFWHF